MMNKTILRTNAALLALLLVFYWLTRKNLEALSLGMGLAAAQLYLALMYSDISKFTQRKNVKAIVTKTMLRYICLVLCAVAAASAGLNILYFFCGFFVTVMALAVSVK